MMLNSILIFCWGFLSLALANVEKTIFVAPPAILTPQDASIDNLLLLPFTPQYSNARTYLNASFPAEQSRKGTETWALLDGLTPGQRYELRICWLATQPTSFWIYTHILEDTFATPALISSLSAFSHARHASLTMDEIAVFEARRAVVKTSSAQTSTLFLQIFAAADYFSLNKTLMENVPPVFVDIILDPFLLNIFPQSLVPTALYIILVAIFAWFLSAWIYPRLAEIAKGVQDRDSHIRKTK